MMSAEFGYLLHGAPSRLANIYPDENARREYRVRASTARLESEAADCPGLLNDLDAVLTFYRAVIKNRDGACLP